jgi:hypothetical protein
MDTHITRDFLKAIAKKFFTAGTSPNPTPVSPASSEPLILPPFGGEMGIEIRSFLGRVEPWLRNGWKVLARRPEYYPPGTAIYDREFFQRESELLQRYGCVRFCYGYLFLAGSQEKMQAPPGASLEVSLDAIAQKVQMTIPDVRDILMSGMFEKELRQLFSGYLLHPDRPPTVWDQELLAVTPFFDYTTYSDVTNIIVPSYQPHDFVQPSYTTEPHIGVQLRARMEIDQRRNSNPEQVLDLAKQVAQAWQLPILIYGHPNGTYLPDGYRHTADDGVEGLLKRELGYLTSCQLMFAPDSGWSELMAWLQVPTLLEKMTNSHTFHWLKPFKPRLDVIRPEADVLKLAEQVRSLPESLPAPDWTLERAVSPEALGKLKQNFVKT